MYSAQASFYFAEGTLTSARFEFLMQLAVACEAAKLSGKLSQYPGFEISTKTDGHYKFVAWVPAKWDAASKFLRLGEREMRIVITDPKDFAAVFDEHERLFGDHDV
jgi:hypothetical protein